MRRRRTPAQGVALVASGLHLVRLAYNDCWTHQSLRVRASGTGRRWRARTPALAAGLADRPSHRADLLRMPVHPIPLTPPRTPRHGRPSARGRILPFAPRAAPTGRSTA